MYQVARYNAVFRLALPAGSTSRRDFMALTGSVLSGAWLVGLMSGCEAAGSHAARSLIEGSALQTFTEREGRDFEAFSALIIPTDDTPGAREAGSVYFADHALGTFFEGLLPAVRPGLADLSDRARALNAEVDGFAALEERQQLDIMRTIEEESPGFFGVSRLLVLLGFVSNPEYGGNRDRVGWRVLGFEDSFQHAPPFGEYDRPVHEGSGA